MALSSIHDVTGHGNATTEHQNVTRIEHVVNEEHQFRPNPDAKPFFPNHVPLATAPANWTIIKENGKNINGIVPVWFNHSHEHENLLVAPGSTNNPIVNKKQHIAFHLVSNVLDDEVPEEKDNVNFGFPNSPRLNMFDKTAHEQVSGAWRTNTEPLNLPLEIVKNTTENNSINNKSIHEIWSPDPSPNGLNNASPTEEINPYVINQQAQQQQQQQTNLNNNSVVVDNGDSADVSFENSENQQQQQQQPPTFSTTGVPSQPPVTAPQVYEDNETERNDAPSPSQYYYPPMYNHHQYIYRGMAPPPHHTQRIHDMYPPVHHHHGRENMMPRPMMYGPSNGPYYGPPPHYNSKYHPPHHHNMRHDDVRYRPKHHKAPPVVYEIKLNYMEELGISLDECRDQLRHLERDYKKAEGTLSREFRLRKSSLGENNNPNKYSSNTSGVDKLINDQEREHQKIESLIGRIERLGFTPMHPNVGVTLDLWLAAIKDLRNTRKSEVAGINDVPGMQYGGKSHSDTDLCNLIESVKKLTKHTRSARTVVWCAMQMLYAHSANNSSQTGD